MSNFISNAEKPRIRVDSALLPCHIRDLERASEPREPKAPSVEAASAARILHCSWWREHPVDLKTAELGPILIMGEDVRLETGHLVRSCQL